jgi:putative polyhydroxyalkanoate system protein
MAKVKVVQTHDVGADEAVKRLDSFEEMVAKFFVSLKWSGHQAQIKGPGVSGSIEVTDTQVTISLKLGMMARAAGVDAERLQGSISKRVAAAFEV